VGVQLKVATPWHFHYGASKVDELASVAAECDVAYMAMCEVNAMRGVVPFQKACDEHGVKPLFAVECQWQGRSAQLLAFNQAGFTALCRIVSEIQSGGLRNLVAMIDEQWQGAGQSFAIISDDEVLLRELKSLGVSELYVPLAAGRVKYKAVQLADALGLPVVAVPQVAYARAEDSSLHSALRAIALHMRQSQLNASQLAGGGEVSAHLRNDLEMQIEYRDYPQALHVAYELARRCHFRVQLGRKRMPRFAHDFSDSLKALRASCARGTAARGLRLSGKYATQLERELQLFAQQGLCDYFLLVEDLVQWANQRGIQNCGRGSAANSLVSYLLGCTHIDPVAHGLWFDRFLHEGRSDFPDIDLDFAWDERDELLDYVYRRHGRNKVALIGTHISFKMRSAVSEISKSLGLPPSEIKRVMSPEIMRQAEKLCGLPRHMGVHPGGMVFAPSDLCDHLPVQHASKQTADGPVLITQWDMGPVEEAGLLKIDLLGNRGLAVVRDARRAVRVNSGVDVRQVDAQSDLRTRQSIARGDTMGCFYIESPGMRQLLHKLKCNDFSTLVAASSIIRPGISQSGMMSAYIERHHYAQRHGKHDDAWYLHPRLREMFVDTYGVMTYQEDVLRVAQNLAGFSAAAADGLRKAMTRKGAYVNMAAWRDKLVAGLTAGGFSAEQANELWRQIESFAGYSFCKAHSASYAELSFRSAYLRCHHPAEFMAAVLSNHGGFYSSFAYIAEAMRMGLTIELPCVNRSSLAFSGRGDRLRVGLSEINKVPHELLERIVDERAAGGPFISLDDFTQRVRPPVKVLSELVRSGALDGLPDGYSRAERMRWAALYRQSKESEQALLFAAPEVPRPPAASEFAYARLLEFEQQSLGYLVSEHPLFLWRAQLAKLQLVAARDMQHHVGQSISLVGWQVTQKSMLTKRGEPMMFLSFEDTSAAYETVLFPRAYKRLAPYTLTPGPYILQGVVMHEHGNCVLQVDDLYLLQESSAIVACTSSSPK
jgi:error-prone DNA polymerase